MYIVAWLSHLRGMERIEGACNSERSRVSQESSAVTVLMDLYSALAEDKATVGCFLDFQEIGLPPSMMKYPLTDRLVQGHCAQLESQ